MEILLVILLALIILDLAAKRWGANSTEDFNSPEWNRRKDWIVCRGAMNCAQRPRIISPGGRNELRPPGEMIQFIEYSTGINAHLGPARNGAQSHPS